MLIFLIQYHITLFVFFVPAPASDFMQFILELSFLLFFYFAAHSFSIFFALEVSKALFYFAFALTANLFLFLSFVIGTFLCLKDPKTIYNQYQAIEDCNYYIEMLIQDLFFLSNLTFYYFLTLILLVDHLSKINFEFSYPAMKILSTEFDNSVSLNFDWLG